MRDNLLRLTGRCDWVHLPSCFSTMVSVALMLHVAFPQTCHPQIATPLPKFDTGRDAQIRNQDVDLTSTDPRVFGHEGSYWIRAGDFYAVNNFSLTDALGPTCYVQNDQGEKTWKAPVTNHVNSVLDSDLGMYIGTERGLFKVNGHHIEPVFVEKPCNPYDLRHDRKTEPFVPGGTNDSFDKSTRNVSKFGSSVWFISEDYGVGRISKDGTADIFGSSGRFTQFLPGSGPYVYFRTSYTDCDVVEVSDDRARSITRKHLSFLGGADLQPGHCKGRMGAAAQFGSDLWLASTEGLYLVRGEEAHKIIDLPPEIFEDGNTTIGNNYTGATTTDLFQNMNAPDELSYTARNRKRTAAPSDIMLLVFRLVHSSVQQRDALFSGVSANQLFSATSAVDPGHISNAAQQPTRANNDDAKYGTDLVRVFKDNQWKQVVQKDLPLDMLNTMCRYKVERFKDVPGVYIYDIDKNLTTLAIPNANAVELQPDDDNNSDVLDCVPHGFLFTDVGTFEVTRTSVHLLSKDLVVQRRENGVAAPIAIHGADGSSILIANRTWALVNHGTIERIPEQPSNHEPINEIRRVWNFSDSSWIATDQGAFLYRNGTIKRVPDLPLHVANIEQVGDCFWLILDREPIVEPDGTPGLSVDEESSTTVYQVYPTATVKVRFDGVTGFLSSILQPLSGRTYLQSGIVTPHFMYVDRFQHALPSPQFDFALDKSRERLLQLIAKDRFSAEGTQIELTTGIQHFYFRVRDASGNMFDEELNVNVLPSAKMMPVFTAMLWFMILASILAFSPYSETCHTAITNPWLRKYGSFGALPLALTLFPALRNYVLLRYIHEVSRDPEFRRNYESFVVPSPEFRPKTFDQLLSAKHTVMLLGRSGMGKTSYAKFMTLYYARQFRVFGHAKIPVFLPMAKLAEGDPMLMFVNQIRKFGRIEDQELIEWFLKQGDFVLFCDGANEVSGALRQKLSGFVDLVGNKNYVSATSQIANEELSWLFQVNLSLLDLKEVEMILARDTPPAALGPFLLMIEQMSLDFYRIPQNLMFAREFLLQGRDVPQSLLGLYQNIFAPIKLAWMADGHNDYSTIVCRRAFRMIAEREPFFEDAEFNSPESVSSELLRARLLVKSGESLMFQHDLLKAFLAATYFVESGVYASQHWEEDVDQDWVAMLEFSLLSLRRAERIAILKRILAADRRTAGLLYNRLRESQPQYEADFELSDFVRQFGEATLSAGV
jgi:hypothetical protein